MAKASGAAADLWRQACRPGRGADRRQDRRAPRNSATRANRLGADGKVVYEGPAIEELIRWRLWDRTGAGMMAELGSHQLDAASIFIAAVHGGVKQHPLSVAAAGNRPLFPADREIEDHVCCIFEFPAPGYNADDPVAAAKKIGVQYASINGNSYEKWGETVLGTEGTLVLDREQDVMLFKVANTEAKTKVLAGKKGKGQQDAKPSLEIDENGDEESAAIGRLAMLPAGRGYAEELEHWAWCIRNRAPENLPHCHPAVALGDAVIAPGGQQGRPRGTPHRLQARVVQSRETGNPRGR